jgi:membrane-associated phospholipid phosphatase
LSRGADLAIRAALRERIAAYWWVKFLVLAAIVTAFFIGYFVLLRFPLFTVTVMPLTFVDRLIPFQPWTLGLYYSLWPYLSLPPALLRTRQEVYAYGWICVALALAGLSFFLFWPTSIPPTTGVDWSLHPGFATLKRVDATQNACPSLHVAFAVFSGVWLDRVLRKLPVGAFVRVLSAVWCVGIVYSTIATRQHVAVDVAAGALLGFVMGRIRPAVLR